MHNIEFPSSEHVYHWRFLMYIDKPDFAQEVLDAATAAEAKAVASRVPRYLHSDWLLYILLTILFKCLNDYNIQMT